MNKIFKYSFFDLIRSRWTIMYFLVYLAASALLLYLGNDLSQAIISLMNIVVVLSPLVSILLGTIYYYNSRDFVELLLAQPIRRKAIFGGQYLGLAVSLSIGLVAGLMIPFLFYGLFVSSEIWNFLLLVVTGTILTFIFTGIAFWIAVKNENKVKGFGLAILVWLVMAILYDGLFLLILLIFEAYPLEKTALVMSLMNPIDLARITLMLQLDIAALLGYSGAVFNKFFGTSLGMTVTLLVSLTWILIPASLMLRIAGKKDF